MISSTFPRPVAYGRFAVVVLVALAALLCVCSSALADTTDAAERAGTSKNLLVEAHAGPFRYLAGATVTVTDPVSGKTMGTAKTLRHGQVRMLVAGEPSRTAPFVVTVTGGRVVTISRGRVRGSAFVGSLTTIVSELGPLSLQRVDVSTTAAAKMPLARTGGFGKNLALVRRALGFVGSEKHRTLQLYSYAVGSQKLLAAVKRAGGYDAFTSMLARTARDQGRVRGLRTRVMPLPHPEYKKRLKQKKPSKVASTRSGAPSTRQSSSSDSANASGAPCAASYVPPTSTSTAGTTALTNFAVDSAAGLLTIFLAGDPLAESPAILEGITGLAVDGANSLATPDSSGTNPQLTSIQNQLDCISQQLSNLQSSITGLSMEMSNDKMSTCQGQIMDSWALYQNLVTTAADNPTVASDQLTASNNSLVSLMGDGPDNIPTMQSTCSNDINTGLFQTGVIGQYPSWPQALSSVQSGNSALVPADVQSLQVFLNYWGSLEYQQMVMLSEYYNYQALIGDSQWSNETTFMMGTSSSPACPQTPSVGNVVGSATSFCQALQNIGDVYPGNTYSDEVGLWTTTAADCSTSACSSSSNAISGLAVSAIPAGFMYYDSTDVSNGVKPWAQTQATPAQLATSCNSAGLPCTGPEWTTSTWSAALANFNAIAPYTNAPAAPQEYWGMPVVDKPNVLSATAGYNLAPYSGFFNSQLNSYVGGGNVVLGSTTSPAWQLVGSGSTVENNNYESAWTYYDNMPYFYTYCGLNEANAFYSPSPWSSGALQASYTYGQTTSCSSSGFPTSPIVALLGSRTWSQSDAWPAAPVITTPLTASGVLPSTTTQLTATGCGSSGCTWGTSGTVPSGWALSSSGSLTMPCGGPAATITVVAGNNSSFSSATWPLAPPAAPSTGAACAPPVVTTTSAVNGTTMQASGCGSSGCTWTGAADQAEILGGVMYCTNKNPWSGSIPVTATNTYGSSPTQNVAVSCPTSNN